MQEFKKMTMAVTKTKEDEVDAPAFKEDLECLESLDWIVGHCQEMLRDDPDLFVDEEGNSTGVELTVGVSEDGTACDWQTGDNSYSGGAYRHPHWAVTGVDETTTWEGLLEELKQQILELVIW